MSILITGGMGYIGSHICLQLLKHNYNVIIVDNLSTSDFTTLHNLKVLSSENFIFYYTDLCSYNDLKFIFDNNKIDIVIHLAGYKAVKESINQPLKYYNNNIIGTLNLLNIMTEYNCKKLIFSSSATVYGSEPSPLKETHQTGVGLLNPYARTKYFIEEIIKDMFNSDKEFSAVILRYFNPIGHEESQLLAENPTEYPNNLFPVLTKVLCKDEEELKIFGDDYDTPDGTCVRDFIHVEDLASAHIEVMSLLKLEGVKIYNVGRGEGTSVKELVSMFEKTNGKIKKRVVERREGDIAVCFANCDKIKEETKWRPLKTIEDAVKLSN